MTIGKIMSKIVRSLPKTEGAAGKITLGRTQIEALGNQNQNAKRLVHATLNSLKNPKLDLAYKAESNYAIAGLRLRDGKEVVGQGAVSITNPGSSQAVVKYRASIDGGKTLQANGFIDGGKVADGKDIAAGMSRKGGKVKSDLEIGQATRHHIEFDEQKGVELANQLDAQYLLKKYTRANNNLQRKLDEIMVDVRKAFRGEVPQTKVNNKIMQKPLTTKEITKFENIDKIMKAVETKKLAKADLDKFYKELRFNPDLSKKVWTDKDISNLIKKYQK